MPSATLSDRAVVRLRGEEGLAFLDRLVTCDVHGLTPGKAAFGALLSPQGKILADFVLQAESGGGFLFDTPRACAAELVRRLGLYRLRAKLVIEDVSVDHAVVVGWDEAAQPVEPVALAPDPRLPELGWRAIVLVGAGPPDGASEAYHAHRLALGVPEGVHDVAMGDAFPHEAIMDQLGGVDFKKGCYVGQEIVSRMQHRGTARTRTVSVAYGPGEGVPPGTEVRAGERVLGRTAGAAASHGLVVIRIDRAADALAAGDAILAGGVPLRFEKPSWVRFPYPGEAPQP